MSTNKGHKRDVNTNKSSHFIGILLGLKMPNWDCIFLQRCVIEGESARLNQEQREGLLDGAHGRRTALNTAVNGYKEEMMKDKKCHHREQFEGGLIIIFAVGITNNLLFEPIVHAAQFFSE